MTMRKHQYTMQRLCLASILIWSSSSSCRRSKRQPSAPFLLCTAAAAEADSTDHYSSSCSSWSPGKLRSQAEVEAAQGNTADALRYLQQAAQLEPDNAVNPLRIYKLQHRQRRFLEALVALERAVELDPHNDEYRSLQAHLLYQLGQCDRAVVEYASLQTANTADVQAAQHCQTITMQAQQAYMAGDYASARPLLTQLLHLLEPGLHTVDWLYQKAQCEWHLSDYYGTVSTTGQVLKLRAHHVDSYALRGRAYYKLGEHDIAMQHYREGLKLDPEHAGCQAGHKLVKTMEKHRVKGQTAYDAGDYATALQWWQKAAAVDPQHDNFVRPLMLHMISCHSRLGQHDVAQQLAQSHIAAAASVDGYWAWGEALQAADDHDGAVRAFQAAVDLVSNSGDQQQQASPELQEARRKLQAAQVALKQSKEKNYYTILGLARSANAPDIKAAYRKLALQWHPDKVDAADKVRADQMFADIAEAYEVLSNVELRQKYDRGEPVFENQGNGQQHHHDPFQFFQQQFHQGGPQQQQGGGGQRFHFRYG